jgi:hypothetical protein
LTSFRWERANNEQGLAEFVGHLLVGRAAVGEMESNRKLFVIKQQVSSLQALPLFWLEKSKKL